MSDPLRVKRLGRFQEGFIFKLVGDGIHVCGDTTICRSHTQPDPSRCGKSFDRAPFDVCGFGCCDQFS